ncbi:MAG: hypothetical protein KC416_14970 [Myxococcales bacterium]|nr:hypothetical protein [Myxococcales bacterium]
MNTIPPIQLLLPQKPPMLLVDQIDRWDAQTVTASTTVSGAWPLVRGDSARAVVCFELMTQSAAAHQALVAMKDGHADARMGVVTGIREMTLSTDKVPVGTLLTIHANLSWGDGDSGLFDAEVLDGPEVIAKSRFSVRKLHALPD